MTNEIIKSPDGNTYCGALAHKFLFNKVELPTFFKLSEDEQFIVLEVVENDGEKPLKAIVRAGQSTRDGAMKYMTSDNRILISNA